MVNSNEQGGHVCIMKKEFCWHLSVTLLLLDFECSVLVDCFYVTGKHYFNVGNIEACDPSCGLKNTFKIESCGNGKAFVIKSQGQF